MRCACEERDGSIVSLCMAHRFAMTAHGLQASADLESENAALKAELAEARKNSERWALVDKIASQWSRKEAERMCEDDHMVTLDHKDEMDLGELLMACLDAARERDDG